MTVKITLIPELNYFFLLIALWLYVSTKCFIYDDMKQRKASRHQM